MLLPDFVSAVLIFLKTAVTILKTALAKIKTALAKIKTALTKIKTALANLKAVLADLKTAALPPRIATSETTRHTGNLLRLADYVTFNYLRARGKEGNANVCI